MGYSHGWNRQIRPDDAQWATIRTDALAIMQASGVPLAGPDGTAASLPGPDGGAIHFDGVGADAYETFRITQSGDDREFCKTERRPYDAVVAAVLCYLGSVTGLYEVHVFDEDDYADGLALARRALPQHAERLRVPKFAF
jgi:hypothetical protein